MVTAITMKIDGLKPLLKAIEQMPEKCRTRILVPAANNAARRMASAIREYVPVQKKKRQPKPHYRDVVIGVVRDYPKTQSVVVVVGPESKMAPHAHLVEEGTANRWSNHRTRYRRGAIQARQVIRKGKLRWVTEKKRMSIGSFVRNKKKPTFFRGRMPAFHPVQKGIDAARNEVSQTLKNDIERGIKRELLEATIARGK